MQCGIRTNHVMMSPVQRVGRHIVTVSECQPFIEYRCVFMIVAVAVQRTSEGEPGQGAAALEPEKGARLPRLTRLTTVTVML